MLVKNIQGLDITNIINNEGKVLVRKFSDSKISCMNDSVKPCIRKDNLWHIMFHAGASELPDDKSAVTTALELAESVTNEN